MAKKDQFEDITDFEKQLLWNVVHGPFEARVNSPAFHSLANKGYLEKSEGGAFKPTKKGQKLPK